jgi:hypothetical protein
MGGFFSRRRSESRAQLGEVNFNQRQGEKLLSSSGDTGCNKENNYCLNGGMKTLKKSKKSKKSKKAPMKTLKRR